MSSGVYLHDPSGIFYDLCVLVPLVTLLDKVVAQRYWPKAQWFALHTIVNGLVVLTCLPDFLLLFHDPMAFLTRKEICSRWPFMLNFVIHIYHIVVYYKTLDWLDWLHHGMMTIVMSPMVFFVDPGPLLNFNHMFILGLPGGLDYLMLVLVKYKVMTSLTEKKINAVLNVWFRCWGILFTCCLSWLRLHYHMDKGDPIEFPEILATLGIVGICGWNALYFMNRVTQNYAVRRYQYLQGVKSDGHTPEPMRPIPSGTPPGTDNDARKFLFEKN